MKRRNTCRLAALSARMLLGLTLSLACLSLATPGVVRELGKGSLGVGAEAYGLRIDPTGRRGVAVTNRGYVTVFDPARIPVTDRIR